MESSTTRATRFIFKNWAGWRGDNKKISGGRPELKRESPQVRYKGNQGRFLKMVLSGVFGRDIVFNCHVFEFAGIKNISAFLALDEFRIFFACHDAYARMSAKWFHSRRVGEWFRGY